MRSEIDRYEPTQAANVEKKYIKKKVKCQYYRPILSGLYNSIRTYYSSLNLQEIFFYSQSFTFINPNS